MNIKIKDFDVNYIDTENGENEKSTVLILHGWGCSIDVYVSLINALKPNYRVICLDMPGFGKTKEPETSWDMDNYTDFIQEFIHKLELKKISLIGHSFGGRVIIKLFDRKNSGKLNDLDFDKVVLMDAAGIKPAKKMSITLRIKLFKFAKRLFTVTPLGKMYPNFIENMRKKAGSADYNSATNVMRETLVKVVNEDLSDSLKYIYKKTLLIWGDLDDATPVSDAYKMKSEISGSELFLLKGAGHYSFLDRPAEVNKKVLSFLAED